MTTDPKDDGNLSPLTPEEIKEIKEIEKVINKTRKLNPRAKRVEKSVKEKKKEYEIISRFLSEYLDSYVIIGFTASSEDFAVLKYNNPMERRALTHLVDEFFAIHFDQLSSNPNSIETDDDEEEDF